MKTASVIIVGLALLIFCGFVVTVWIDDEQVHKPEGADEHLYVTSDTMEFDKCVAYWLITRFIDPDAEFAIYPEGTEIAEGKPFDVPGAAWSRKHLKSTSMCILESMDCNDAAVEKIVEMAGQVELNFWQLDRWGETQKIFYEVKEIIDTAEDKLSAFTMAGIYFDELYSDLKDMKMNSEYRNQKTEWRSPDKSGRDL